TTSIACICYQRILRPQTFTLCPYTTLFRSADISRTSMLIPHGVLGAVTGALGLAFSVFGMYGASIAVEGLGLTLGDYMLTALNYTPAVIFFAGLSMLLIGISRKLHTLIWVYFIY